MVDIWQTAEILHQLEMEPATEEQQLSADEVLLLLCGIGQLVHILQSHIGLADTIPGCRPQFVIEVATTGIETAIQPATAPTIKLLLPMPEVALVYGIDHVIVDTYILYLVFTPVPRIGIVATLHKVGDTLVQLFHKALEVTPVLIGIGRRNFRVGCLVKVVGAGDPHPTSPY